MIFPKNSADDFVRRQPHILNRDIFPADALIETDQLRDRFVAELNKYRNAAGQLFCKVREPLLKVAFLTHKGIPQEVTVYPEGERFVPYGNRSTVALFRIDEKEEATEHAKFLSETYKIPVREERERQKSTITITDKASIRADGYASTLALALCSMTNRLGRKITASTEKKNHRRDDPRSPGTCNFTFPRYDSFSRKGYTRLPRRRPINTTEVTAGGGVSEQSP